MTAHDGANLDASTFDLDAWIDDVVRPEITVELYPFEPEYAAKVAAIEAQMPAAEAATDRGMDDASPESLLAQLADLRAERDRTTVRVRVRQILDAEIVAAAQAAKAAGVDPLDATLWPIAAACVEPAFTGEQLARLARRDRSGNAMVGQLIAAVNGLLRAVPVPSSPGR